jgi:endonuclease/exonuclease/phosphatase family metal-dependent hydrolase
MQSKPNRKTPPILNDNISRLLRSGDFVPKKFEGSDRFLDIISWNIKFFNDRDPKRVENIRIIMQELNADIFVLQEIEDGALEPIADMLNASGAGMYKTAYGTTGGDQRVAFMYDMEWVKASTDIEELFALEDLMVEVGDTEKVVFPRLPLSTTFTAYKEDEPFDFNLVGVHLKSQRGGGQEQRTAAAERLAEWIQDESTDEDVIIAGDWNAPPERPEWQPLRQMEVDGKLKFISFNKSGETVEPSYLSVGNRRSRLDLIVVSSSVPEADIQQTAAVVNWNVLLENGNSMQTKATLESLIENISDHLPVLARFYFSDTD